MIWWNNITNHVSNIFILFVFKITLATLFLVCLLDMPYGYYQVVRLCAVVGFGILAYESFCIEKGNLVILYIGLVLLFQPFIKLALGRNIWNIVDVLVAIGLIISVIININESQNKAL